MIFGILEFPHSICTQDFEHALGAMLDQQYIVLNCKTEAIPDVDVLILSDYIEKEAWPSIKAIETYLQLGKKLLAIGDGVRTMVEWGMLPGKLTVNISERIFSNEVGFVPVNLQTFLTNDVDASPDLLMSVTGTHCRWELGNDYNRIEQQGQILFRYSSLADEITDINDPSQTAAGVANNGMNVFGILFHPERAVDDEIGNTDGRSIFLSMIKELETV